MAYCCLILFGKLIQQIVFGHLRVVEQQVNIVHDTKMILQEDFTCSVFKQTFELLLYGICFVAQRESNHSSVRFPGRM